VTAEIAVMNREAVALAADSAVSGAKIFTSANKIFALSKYQPVALMIYDSAQFLDVPWETIIKSYRAELGSRSFGTLREQAAHFLGFFDRANPLFPSTAQREGNEALFRRFFLAMLDHIDSKLEERAAEGEELTEGDITEQAALVIAETHHGWMRVDDIPSLPVGHLDAVLASYGEEIDRAIESFEALPLSDETRERLEELAAALVTKAESNVFSPFHTGVVIAGFGRDEYFPALFEFELETIALNRLKYRQRDETQIGSEDGPAVVRAFAQHEQVATFMRGMDAELTDATLLYWSDELVELVVRVAQHLAMSEAQTDQLLEEMAPARGEMIEKFADELDHLQSEMNVGPIIRVVAMMPKDELAAMAEALVNLTSFKRKVTVQEETVGGPIDVAVISKGDGLVWIKRKHYFEPELNPQFFANYYREG
jgi:hypothetical protein